MAANVIPEVVNSLTPEIREAGCVSVPKELPGRLELLFVHIPTVKLMVWSAPDDRSSPTLVTV